MQLSARWSAMSTAQKHTALAAERQLNACIGEQDLSAAAKPQQG